MWTNTFGNFGIKSYYLVADKLLESDQAYSECFLLWLQSKHINVKEMHIVFDLFLALVIRFGWQTRFTLQE